MTLFVEIFTCINNYNKLKPSGCNMSNFRNQLDFQSKQLVKRFSTKPVFSLKYSGDYHRNEYSKEEWCKFVEKNANLDIRADLTFKQSIEEYSAPVLGVKLVRNRVPITEDLALINIAQFMNRLNYASYKNAYRRYGKRLEIISGIEGGRCFYRDNRFRHKEESKRLHAHLLIQKPKHIPFEIFKGMILQNWYATDWGYYEANVELIDSIKGSAKYQVESSLDSLDLKNTFISAGM